LKVQRGLITLSGIDLSGEVVLDTPVPVANSFVVSSVRLEPYLWSSPETHEDWEDAWDDEEFSYDGDVDTYAFTDSNEYLEFPFDNEIPVEKIRVRVKFVLSDLTLGTPDIDVDVYREEDEEGEWHNIYSDEVSNDEWVEIIPYMDFESIRIKFNNTFNFGDYGFLAEIQLYDVATDTLNNALCRVELDGVSGDNYTKIKATRQLADNDITKAEWQVVYGDEFNVQSGIIDCNDLTTEVLQGIDEVDLLKSFIVHTNYTSDERASKAFFMADFSSSEEISFSRGNGEAGDINSIRWYVVEWDGATVNEYAAELDEDTVVIEIDEVNPVKAFLVSSYSELGYDTSFSFTRGDIVSSGEVSFTRGGIGNSQSIGFFTVEHPDFNIYHDSVSTSGVETFAILDDLVSVNRCFMYTPQIGNAYSTVDGFGTMFCGFNTHNLRQDGEDSVVTIERGSLGGELYASYSVVGYATSLLTITTGDYTDKTYFSIKAHGNITDDGGFDVSRRGFCYIRSDSGVPTVDDYVVYEDGTFEAGEYSLDITGLNPSRTYRLRAYAVTMFDIGYGNTITISIDSVPMSEFCGKDVEDIGFVNKFKAPEY